MADDKSDIERIAAKLKAEVAENAPILAKRLFGPKPQGTKQLSRPQYLEYVRRHWADQSFRAVLRRQMGDRAFVALAKEVAAPVPVAPTAPLPMEGLPVA